MRKANSASGKGRASTKKRRPARQRHAHAQAHATRKATPKRWSHHVMETSDAMDIEHDIFKTGTPTEIAASLKQSSSSSKRRKGSPFQSAMSMLNFYINRAGRNLPKARRDALQRAKGKLREAFGREP